MLSTIKKIRFILGFIFLTCNAYPNIGMQEMLSTQLISRLKTGCIVVSVVLIACSLFKLFYKSAAQLPITPLLPTLEIRTTHPQSQQNEGKQRANQPKEKLKRNSFPNKTATRCLWELANSMFECDNQTKDKIYGDILATLNPSRDVSHYTSHMLRYHHYINQNSPAIADLLVRRHGADIFYKDKDGRVLLMDAIKCYNIKMCQYLLQKYPTAVLEKYKISEQETKRVTPLQYVQSLQASWKESLGGSLHSMAQEVLPGLDLLISTIERITQRCG